MQRTRKWPPNHVMEESNRHQSRRFEMTCLDASSREDIATRSGSHLITGRSPYP